MQYDKYKNKIWISVIITFIILFFYKCENPVCKGELVFKVLGEITFGLKLEMASGAEKIEGFIISEIKKSTSE